MKNIIIYNETGASKVKEILDKVVDYDLEVKKPECIKDIQAPNVDLAIFELSKEATKDLLSRNKVPVPTLLVSDCIIENLPVRTEAFDYIITPIAEEELLIRVKNLIKIKELKNEIRRVSTTDYLTGLYNRTYLHERLEAELSRSKRYNDSLSCLLLDIDFFKVVNDIYGYDWGDVLLKDITEVIKRRARKEDILTRYGDEEFIVLLPNTDEENAYLFADRIRADIEEMEFKPDNEEERHPITISGGIASYPFPAGEEETAHTIIRYAEHALYTAKSRGKNKIIKFTQINLEV